MDAEDPRVAALLAVAGSQIPPALITWMLRSFDALEAVDFGELEPLGVAAPFATGPTR